MGGELGPAALVPALRCAKAWVFQPVVPAQQREHHHRPARRTGTAAEDSRQRLYFVVPAQAGTSAAFEFDASLDGGKARKRSTTPVPWKAHCSYPGADLDSGVSRNDERMKAPPGLIGAPAQSYRRRRYSAAVMKRGRSVTWIGACYEAMRVRLTFAGRRKRDRRLARWAGFGQAAFDAGTEMRKGAEPSSRHAGARSGDGTSRPVSCHRSWRQCSA